MQAYEFFAKPENGFIRIPEELKNRITYNVKVILLDNNSPKFDGKEAADCRKSDLLLPPTLNTSGWKFSRDEANER